MRLLWKINSVGASFGFYSINYLMGMEGNIEMDGNFHKKGKRKLIKKNPIFLEKMYFRK